MKISAIGGSFCEASKIESGTKIQKQWQGGFLQKFRHIFRCL